MMDKQSLDTSRRQFLSTASLAIGAVCLTPGRLLAEEAELAGLVERRRRDAASAKITVLPLRGNISVLMGAGGNIAVLTGDDGKLLVDSGIVSAHPKITESLGGIGTQPVRHVINTHWHFDHTDGNEWLHAEGAAILAHQNTRKRLSTTTRVEGWDFTFPPSPRGALPTETIKTDKTLRVHGETIVIKYYGPSHTDSDLSIYFTGADVFHTGDTWWNGVYPFIDYSTGGSINGMIRATEQTLSKVTDKTLIIAGHGPVGSRAQLAEYRDMLVTVRDKVATLKKQGKPLEEVIAEKPTSPFDARMGMGTVKPDYFAKLVFTGV